MRSKSNGMDNPADGVLVVPRAVRELGEPEAREVKLPATEKANVQREGERKTSGTEKDDQTLGLKDLSKDDLLQLLGVMEREIQAREDVIRLLRARLGCPEVLESQYGSACPTRPLQALQRDGLLLNGHIRRDNVYEKPMAELDRLQYKHRETYRRMLEQLLLAEKCHRRTVHELDTEKRKHADYMNKSDDFTNLLEQERERLKLLLKQEKAFQIRKEKEHSKRLEKVRRELIKLKTFALVLVDEQQFHLEQIDQQSQKIQELHQQLQEKEQELSGAESKSKEDGQKLLRLEVELEVRSSKFAREHDEMTAKLASQEAQHRQLCQKQGTLSQTVEELERKNVVLLKSAEELQELRDKISKGECGNSNLMAELENLRKRVLEMEGKDEEIAKAENQCRELKKKLQAEGIHSKELKLEVDNLQKRMTELERLEAAFSVGRTECAHLQGALEKERTVTKELADELVMVKIRMKELESSELKLEKAELVLKEELAKLKSVAVMMVNEHKNMAERVRSEEKRREELDGLFKAEQEKVTEVTERLIDESKRFLKLKSEMERKITTLIKEKEELKVRHPAEEEECRDLSSKSRTRKHTNEKSRNGGNESTIKAFCKDEDAHSNSSRTDEKEATELSVEVERLRSRLKQLEVVEGDLIKTEDEYDVLKKRFKREQEKANSLSRQVEEMRSQIASSKEVERGEAAGQETELRRRCRSEEARNRDLQADVQALKEKIHELMNKEDQLSQLQVDYSVLQRKFLEEEDKKKNMSNEVLDLTKELEMTKRYSRALRPSSNGRRMVDVPVTSTGVQTDAAQSPAADDDDDDTPAVFIKKSVQEENHIMRSLRQRSVKKSTERPTVRELYPPAAASDLSLKKSWIPWIRKKDCHVQSAPERANSDGETVHSEIKLTQKQGQPLHVRVTPDRQSSKTTLQVSGSPADNIFNGSVATPSQSAQKPQILIIPSTVVSPNERSREPRSLERAKSPLTITTVSRTKSPESIKTAPPARCMSPVSFMSVNTSILSDTSSSPEPQEMITDRAVFKVTPEKRVVPMPIKKCNIVATEDNKIHNHLGPPFKKACENSSSAVALRHVAAESKELSVGTVLRSPRQGTACKAAASKVMSSITITQVNTSPARPTLSVQPVAETQTFRCGLTRIPMSRGMKAGKAVVGAPGISAGVRTESKAEGQSMCTEVKKPSVSGKDSGVKRSTHTPGEGCGSQSEQREGNIQQDRKTPL